jgi:ribonucleoside-diphosphate reductase alpha chain
MNKEIFIKKRNGNVEKFNADKINKILQWATEDIKSVSFEEVAMNAHLSFFDGMTSKDIHAMLIEASANLISEDKPNYQYVASRLLNYQLRKNVWGGKNPPKLYDIVKANIDTLVYDEEILNWYTKQEFDKLDEFLRHDRDFNFTYAGIKQLCDKYMVQNRVTKQIYETPQFAYMLIAMTFFKGYKENRLDYIKKAYNYFSKHKINLPTPIMAGVRTPMKSYASCSLFTVDDDLRSIFSNNSAVGFATASRYGIGLNLSRLRATNAPIRNGEVVHTGPIPFAKAFESTVKSCHQNGIRGGSATVNFAWFHYDILDILVLKNNQGTDDNRVRKLDYCVGLDKLIFERFLKNQDVTLFSYHECPSLWNTFGMEGFKEKYEKAEANKNIKFKKKVPARELMGLLAKERLETGRIYTMFVDHANEHGSWLDQVDTSNLCLEVNHPLIPIYDVNDPDGEIGVCVLAALNWLEIKDDNEMESVCDIIVRMLDALIDHQEYFVPAAKNFATKRRSLGVGVSNLAALLAKEELKYWDVNAPNFVSKWMEKTSYYLIKASVEMAKELGKCEKFDRTKFSQGILPIDTYKRDVDEFITEPLHCDWETLREEIKKYGMRHSTLTACMPVESSSVIQSSTNGIEPPRSAISFKGSKSNILPVVVPNIDKYKDNYTFAFDMPSNEGYLKVAAAIQKFTDMSISTNTYYIPSRYEKNKVPVEVVIKDILLAYKYGLKNLYYANTDDGDKQTAMETKSVEAKPKVQEESGCASGACAL